ncbi:MAG: thiamine pyrophosphate-binding protein [Candidatus Scalindua sp.]|jgi:acetolactate synthase I/II/III large subunit|nr:thiamine pyrophosphate-binding protein [Candidatus Scalindua sp.]
MKDNMRVCDLIVDYFYQLGVDTIFTVTGGGAMFLNDGLASHERMKAICNHHEQSSAMAAVGYAKFRNDYGVAMVTTGCGATNAITGVLDAWQDNVPCIFVSGQVKSKETCHNADVPLRQFGVQEADIVAVIKTITKYSVMLSDPEDILFELQKATFIAKSGRPGPVWLDVPLDMQGVIVKPQKIKQYTPDVVARKIPSPSVSEIRTLHTMLSKAKRPIIIAGNGIRLGNCNAEFKNLVETLNIPFAVSYLAVDLLPSNHPEYVGRLGIKGDRAGNFAVQNSDLVISLGCRLSVALTGFEYQSFAREAKLIVVDIDKEEHKKGTVEIDVMIHSDLGEFFRATGNIEAKPEWLQWREMTHKWREQWPVVLPDYANEKNGINKYYFIEKLIEQLDDDSVVVSDAGSTYYVTSQALKIRANQRYLTSGAQADMGFTLPAAIGAAIAKKGEVIGITGDGSLQMNIQELQTLVHSNVPVKLVVWNNNGYLSIRATQRKFFSGRELGTDYNSGISFPKVEKISQAYGIPYYKAETSSNLPDMIKSLLDETGPAILEVMCPHNQEIIPAVSSIKLPNGKMVSKPLEDMYPFMEREEFLKNMIISPVDEC